MPILKTETVYEEPEQRIVNRITYDNTDVLRLNAEQRAGKIDGAQFKGAGLVHVGRIDNGDVERLMGMGYNLLSPDPEEVRRALFYIQSEEKNHLTVNKKPFAKKRAKWV